MDIAKGNEEYCKTLGLFGESLQIKDPLFNVIEGMIFQVMDFKHVMSVTFYMTNVMVRNFLNILIFRQ